MNKSDYRKKMILLLGDIFIIVVLFYLAPFVRFKTLPDPLSFFGKTESVALFVYISVLYFFEFYNMERKFSVFNTAIQFALIIILINILNSSLMYLLNLRAYSSWVLFINSSLTLIFLMFWRLVYVYISGILKDTKRILIFGAGNSGRAVAQILKAKSDYQVIGFVDDDAEKNGIVIDGVSILGDSRQLADIIKKYSINKVIVCAGQDLRREVYRKLVQAGFGGVSVSEMPVFYERITGKIPVLRNSYLWPGFAERYGVKKNIYNIKIKNVMDKILGAAGFIVAAPLLIGTAILIKIDSKGPVIYAQKRVGLNEEIFVLYKFRSMCIDAESNGAVWAVENDPRITRVGKFIRLLRIDELPQFWNVLKGEMSFVGPRPERPEFVTRLETEVPYYMLRHCVKPGITGWAQINYPYGDSVEDAREKLQYDLFYIKNQSFLLDLYIMLNTGRVVLFGMGAR